MTNYISPWNRKFVKYTLKGNDLNSKIITRNRTEHEKLLKKLNQPKKLKTPQKPEDLKSTYKQLIKRQEWEGEYGNFFIQKFSK